MPLTQPNKGSVLVFSLIVLSIVLSAALSVAVVNVSNRKSAGSTGQSVQSFQVADSGVEKALKEIYKGSYASLNALQAAIASSTSCASGKFSFPVSGGTSTVTFFDTDNNPLSCTSSTWRDDVVKIKVEGTSNGTTRVIETAIAAPVATVTSTQVCVGPSGSASLGNHDFCFFTQLKPVDPCTLTSNAGGEWTISVGSIWSNACCARCVDF